MAARPWATRRLFFNSLLTLQNVVGNVKHHNMMYVSSGYSYLEEYVKRDGVAVG